MQSAKKSTKKSAPKKTTAKKAAAKKSTTKKASAKKATEKKTAAKKSTAAKAASKKTPAKKQPVKKTATKASKVATEKVGKVAKAAGIAVSKAAAEAEKVTTKATRGVASAVQKAARAVDKEIKKTLGAAGHAGPAARKSQNRPAPAMASWQPSLVEPEGSHPRYHFSSELPTSYQSTYLTAIPRDPEWIFLYWEFADSTMDAVRGQIGADAFGAAQPVLRLLDVTDVQYDGSNAWSAVDTVINTYADNWYLRVPQPGRQYLVEYGFLTEGGTFHLVLRSNLINVPRDGISEVVDEEWSTASGLDLVRLSRKGKRYRVFGSQHLMEEEIEEEFAAPSKVSELNAPSSLFIAPSSFINAPSSAQFD